MVGADYTVAIIITVVLSTFLWPRFVLLGQESNLFQKLAGQALSSSSRGPKISGFSSREHSIY